MASSPSSSPSMLRGASLLIILQLGSRLITFTANQLLLRYLTASLLGLSAQLEVYYLSVLFFARESLRVAIQRQGVSAVSAKELDEKKLASQDKKQDESLVARESQAVVNLGYLSVFLGAPTALLLGYMYLRYTDPDTISTTPYLTVSLYLYGVASVLELLSEPCFVLMQTRLEFGTRARAESLATFFRCAMVFSSAVVAHRQRIDAGVLPFALGQIVYGAVLVLVYLVSGWKLSSVLNTSLLPTRVQGDDFLAGGLFYKPTITLASSMMAQSLVKHILTQGDTFLVSALSTTEVQGVYALANNYGGLLARLLFQPVEESSRSYFSRLLASSTNTITSTNANTGTDTSTATSGDTKDDKDSSSSASSPVLRARQDLRVLLRAYFLLSLPIAVFGPLASPHLLRIVAGPHWSIAAGPVLALFALYIPFLALNGLTESFVASVATEAEVHVQSLFMFVFTLVFAGVAWLFMGRLGLGARGLVLANAVNMGCRILWSWRFMSHWFASRNVRFQSTLFVPWTGLAVGGATIMALRWADSHQVGLLSDENPLVALIKIGATAVPFMFILAVVERQFLTDVVTTLTRKTKTQ